MADYYSILGLTKNATDIEIKAAFRRLAKIYHPDKNPDPNARQLFEHILKAYDTLINPHTRRRYDNLGTTTVSPKQRQNQANPKTRGQKEWSTDEEDLKRREYYKQHYHQAKYKAANVTEQKNTYSDYKYVLFATPIAVGLLMIIISLFSSEPKASHLPEIKSTITTPAKEEVLSPSNGDKPYNGFFGAIKTFDTQHILQINNSSGYDAIIAIFDNKTNAYLQHAYLKNAYKIEFSKLPDSGVYWKCVLGKNWNKNNILLNNKISGGFDSTIQYQNWKSSPSLFKDQSNEEVTLLYVLDEKSKNKKYISSDIDFFEKQP